MVVDVFAAQARITSVGAVSTRRLQGFLSMLLIPMKRKDGEYLLIILSILF